MFLEGKQVSGSDMSENVLTRELSELGIKIIIGQGFELIPKDTELIVIEQLEQRGLQHIYSEKKFKDFKNKITRSNPGANSFLVALSIFDMFIINN